MAKYDIDGNEIKVGDVVWVLPYSPGNPHDLARINKELKVWIQFEYIDNPVFKGNGWQRKPNGVRLANPEELI